VTKNLDDLQDNNNVKVINPPSNLSDNFDPPLLVKEDDGQLKDVEEESFQDPSIGNILQQLNKVLDIALEQKDDKTLKVYWIFALELLLNICGHSKLAPFVKKGLFVMCQVNCLLAWSHSRRCKEKD
jgi:hypothetical protein